MRKTYQTQQGGPTEIAAEMPDCAGRNGAPANGKHTPGPWMAEWELSLGAFCQVSAFSTEGNRVLRCAIESFRPVEDARLISAAPELLDALKAMQPLWHHMIGLSSPAEWHRVNGLMEDAIAKAEGRP